MFCLPICQIKKDQHPRGRSHKIQNGCQRHFQDKAEHNNSVVAELCHNWSTNDRSYLFKPKINKTSMHSSRMRTARWLTICLLGGGGYIHAAAVGGGGGGASRVNLTGGEGGPMLQQGGASGRVHPCCGGVHLGECIHAAAGSSRRHTTHWLTVSRQEAAIPCPPPPLPIQLRLRAVIMSIQFHFFLSITRENLLVVIYTCNRRIYS